MVKEQREGFQVASKIPDMLLPDKTKLTRKNMITLRDITSLIAMLYWGTMLVCALGSIFVCYKAQPKFLKKYP